MREAVAAQKVLLPAVFISDITTPTSSAPVAAPGRAAEAAPRINPARVVTGGSNSTGGELSGGSSFFGGAVCRLPHPMSTVRLNSLRGAPLAQPLWRLDARGA